MLVNRGAGFLFSQERRTARWRSSTYPSRHSCARRNPVQCTGFSRIRPLHKSPQTTL